jgi:hypothetical protein
LTRPLAPDAATFRRVLAGLDAAVLDGLIGAFVWARIATVEGRRVIALDGKTLRGARPKTAAGAQQSAQHQPAPHLVAAFDHGSGTVLGQLATAAKSNELWGRCAAPGWTENGGHGRPGRRRGILVRVSP